MGKQLTIRGVPEEVAARLARLSAARGKSINSTVLEILEAVVGVDRKRRRLERYATWTDDDLTEFLAALREQRVIDEELWG